MLNVLVAVGLSIAVSGWLLRKRVASLAAAAGQNPQRLPLRRFDRAGRHQLCFEAAESQSARAGSSPHAAIACSTGRTSGPALIASLAIPVGFAYGWLVSTSARRGHPLLGCSPRARFPLLSAEIRAGRLHRFLPVSRTGSVMTPSQITILSIYAVIVAIWPIRLVVIEVILGRQRILSSDSPRYEQPDPPLVSAILPAKDEELNLAECLSSVCQQTYPNLEILVVDDRSTDRTGEIARGFAERDPRVRVLSIEHLPPGWTGKTHALDQALRHVRGQWLWFFDADTTHAPESLSIVMEYGRSEGAAP